MIADKLNYGDTIGVVGVSNSLDTKEKYEQFIKAEQFFKTKGFNIRRGKYLFNNYYGAAGTKEEKAEDLMNMFKDKEVKAIICLEGGQTCNTFIDLLDYEVIKKNPKILTGYSDITILLQTINKMTGLITFNGSNFIDYGLDDAEERFEEFESVFINKEIKKFYKGDKKIIRSGNIEGILIGTNLGCMMYLLGTKYLQNFENKILAIESYKTSPNECQRRFSHLKQCGVFDKIKGIIIGYNYDLQKDGNTFPQMEDILLEYVEEYSFPIVKCNDFGHKIVTGIIPVGVKTKIDSDNQKIEIIEEFLN